ncbi:MAG: SRPBCC family protein [Hyphomicrobium sp.]
MLKRLALALALAGIAPMLAQAHGPTRQKVTETIEINAAPDKVWAVIGNFQDMGWHPAFTKTQGAGGNAPDATRKLTLGNGATIDEKLTKFAAEAKSYSYEITNVDVKVVPVTNYASTISVSGEGDKSKVEWKGAFYRGYVNNDPPPELSDEAAVKAITGVYKDGLAALKKKLEGGS